MRVLGWWVVVKRGEVVGPGVQGNKYGMRAVELRVFNLYDISAAHLVEHAKALDLLKEMRLEVVPHLGTLTFARR